MPTAKARYTGRTTDSKVKELSEKSKDKLLDLHGRYGPPLDLAIGDRGNRFVQAICSEVHWAVAELQEHPRDLTKAETRAEHKNLLRSVLATCEKARRLSPDYRRLYPVNNDLVEKLDEVAVLVHAAGENIAQLPAVRKSAEKQHAIEVEMAIRVLRILKQYGIPVSATADVDMDRASPAVQILKVIGDDIKLRRSAVTWRGVIIDAQRRAPDLVK